MKPYILVVYNKIRFIYMKLFKCRKFCVKGISLLGYSTKFVTKPTSIIEIGDRVISDGRFIINVDGNGKLTIGSKVYFNEDTMISCKDMIYIGNGCKFGPNVKIFDNNHKFDAKNGVSNQHSSGEIEIGENCWIGSNVVILKGAKIGRNSVIGAGCVIDTEIPEASIVTQTRSLIIKEIR